MPQMPPPIDFNSVVSNVKVGKKATDLIKAIEQKRQSRLICIVFNEHAQVQLAPPMIEPLESVLENLGKVERLDVFLRSTGGIAEVPWRIVSLLREYTDHLGIIISGFALSGGTHIAIAGDDLIMMPSSHLGPIDPTKQHPLLPRDPNGNPIPTSVQDLKDLVKFLEEQLGESFRDAAIISELFKYINPLAIGALEQTYNLSRLITKKVLQTRKEKLSHEQIEKVQDTLASKYYSHGFYITRTDVESDLGLPVLRPDEELSEMIKSLLAYFKEQFAIGYTDPKQSGVTARIAAFVQSSEEAWGVTQIMQGSGIIADAWIKV